MSKKLLESYLAPRNNKLIQTRHIACFKAARVPTHTFTLQTSWPRQKNLLPETYLATKKQIDPTMVYLHGIYRSTCTHLSILICTYVCSYF
jgi:hypothetical protein